MCRFFFVQAAVPLPVRIFAPPRHSLAASCAPPPLPLSAEVVDQLLARRADPDAGDVEGDRPLVVATVLGRAGVLHALLTARADPAPGPPHIRGQHYAREPRGWGPEQMFGWS